MTFCKENVIFPYFTVTRVFRDKNSLHYSFVGLENYKNYKNTFEKISNGSIQSIDILKSVFTSDVIKLWKSIVNKGEKIYFIDDMLWTDDSLYKIKKKIFVYLSTQKDFILPENQQLWVSYNDRNQILGASFEKEEYENYIYHEPAIFSKPAIDTTILSQDNEIINILYTGDENKDIILHDHLQELDINNTYQIYVYSFYDEVEWIQNNPIVENNQPVDKKRYINGYIYKHWPNAKDRAFSSEETFNLHNKIKKELYEINKLINKIRDDKTDSLLGECNISNMNIYSRQPFGENDIYFRLDIIYNYLRTLLSKDIPFLFYTSYGDRKPYISISEKHINNIVSEQELKDWVYKKVSKNNYILKGQEGSIIIKLLNYIDKNGKGKFITITLTKIGHINFQFTYESSIKSSIQNIENTFNNISVLIKKINVFLKNIKHSLYEVPTIKIENNELIFSKYINIQFFTVDTLLKSKERIYLGKYLEFIKEYYPFIDTTILETNQNKKIFELKYQRISNIGSKYEIFDLIEKQEKLETEPEQIINMIKKQFGKTSKKANDIYKKWKILQIDKVYAKEIIKAGVSIKISKTEIFNEKDGYTYKIIIRGLNSLYIMRNCYSFIEKSFSLFINQTENKLTSNNNLLDFNIGDNLDDNNLNVLNKLSRNNINNNIIISDENFTSTKNINMSNEKNLDPKTKLKCEKEDNKIISKGVCKDVCEFKAFKLNRLQHFEPTIFKKKYSRICPESRRPIVISYDPEKESRVDKSSFTYAIKYKKNKNSKENYYICPQAWCPICEIPIPLDKIKDIERKNKECIVGKCPNGNHKVIINNSKDQLYPGFLDKSSHSSGYCMTCCFGKNQLKSDKYKKCKEDENIENDNSIDKKDYIYRQGVSLSYNKYARLPDELEILFRQNSYSGIIKNGFNFLVRKGVLFSNTNSFINVILDIVSNIHNKKIIYEGFVNKINEYISSDKIFYSLSSGLLKRIFKSKEKYINYLLKTDETIPLSYLWDVITRPGVFYKNGFNIIIITTQSIFCPYGQNPEKLYSFDKPTILIIKNNNLYEPIYRLKKNNDKIEYNTLHDSNDENIKKIIIDTIHNCSSFNEINWSDASGNNFKDDVSLNTILNNIKDKYRIKTQIIDSYSKTTGIILNNDLYIPIKPSAIDINYPIIQSNEDKNIPKLSFEKTISLLKKFIKDTKLNINPQYIILNNKSDIVIGILLETRRVIPIKSEKIKTIKTSLPVSNKLYYIDTNNSNKYKKERVEKIKEYYYNIELFERFKYELSEYFQTNEGQSIKNEIESIIKSKNNYKDKYNKILKIIETISNKIVSTINGNVQEYDKFPMLRTACFNQIDNKDPFCNCKNKKCKLVNIKKDFIYKISDIFVRYSFERDEILNGLFPKIDLEKAIKQNEFGEILLTGNKIDDDFNKIFNSKDQFKYKLVKNIDFISPSFEGINKEKYYIKRKSLDIDLLVHSTIILLPNWISIHLPIYRTITISDTCNSIYYIVSEFVKGLQKFLNKNSNYIVKNDISLADITYSNIINFYISFLLSLKKEDVKTIAKEILKDSEYDIDNIIDISDFYNILNESDFVKSTDELIERIKIGYPTYKTSLFDLYIFVYLLNIKIILLRKSISVVIGNNFSNNELYGVVYYTLDKNNCIHFYMLQKEEKPYISKLNSDLKRLI